MQRDRAIALATKRVLRHQLARVAKGQIPGAAQAFDREDAAGAEELAIAYLAKEAKRNKAEIDRVASELMTGARAVAPCAKCPSPSTTVIAGAAYCDAHAATAQRLPCPEGRAA